MTDKKLIDNEIVKALEKCINLDCEKCSSRTRFKTATNCRNELLALCLDLINRQKAEIERLREIRDLCNTTILEKNEQIEKLKISDASKEECTIRQHNEIKELRAEIERLKKGWKADVILTADAKAEAYKEFAEEYKDQIKNYTGIFTDDGFMVNLEAVLSAVDFIKNKLVDDDND